MADPSKSTSDGYPLERSASASARLNLQHYIWRQVCGFDIHPDIPIPTDGKLKVADVATGTGIWMSCVKQKHPSFEIDGFDLSFAQCAPAELLPQGCSLRRLNILEDIPEDLRNSYDVVNMKLMIASLKNESMAVRALRNLVALLKPGGYLQWQDINISTTSVLNVTGADQTVMEQLLGERKKFEYGRWAARLAEIFVGNGLPGSTTSRYRVPPELSIPWLQTQFGAWEEFSKVGMDNSSQQAEGPRLRELIGKGYTELSKGVVYDYGLEVTVGKKPA